MTALGSRQGAVQNDSLPHGVGQSIPLMDEHRVYADDRAGPIGVGAGAGDQLWRSRISYNSYTHMARLFAAQGDVGSCGMAGPPLYYIDLAGNNLASVAWTTKRGTESTAEKPLIANCDLRSDRLGQSKCNRPQYRRDMVMGRRKERRASSPGLTLDSDRVFNYLNYYDKYVFI